MGPGPRRTGRGVPRGRAPPGCPAARGTRKKLAAAVKSSGTTLTEVFGVGPIIAATVLGYVGDVHRFPTKDRFAAYNGTAPIAVLGQQ